MLVYFIMLLAIALIYYFCDRSDYSENKKKRTFLIRSGILIVLIVGSRWEGYQFADTGMYVQNFDNSKKYGLGEYLYRVGRDRGYYLIVWCLARILPSSQWFIYFECALLIFSVFLFVYHMADQPLLAVFLFLGTGIFSFYMSAFRQAFAFSFCLLSFLVLEKVGRGKRRWDILKLLVGTFLFYIATQFHMSAVVFIIALLGCLIKNQKIKIVTIVVAMILIIVFRENLLSAANDVMDKEYEIESEFSMIGFMIQIIIFVFPMTLLCFVPPEKTFENEIVTRGMLHQEKQYYDLLSISIVGLVFYLLRIYMQGFERVAIYFTIAICALYSAVFNRTLNEENQKTLTWVMCVLCGILFLWRAASAGAFIFFWQK